MGTTNYHWDPIGDCVLLETDQSANVIATYTHEPGQSGPLLSENRGGTEYYHHYDALGSTTFLTNDTGTVTDTFLYDAWGNSVARVGLTPTPYQWFGQSGYCFLSTQYFLTNRSYSPALGRWTTSIHGTVETNQLGLILFPTLYTVPLATTNNAYAQWTMSLGTIPLLARTELPLSIVATDAKTQRCRRLAINWKISAEPALGIKKLLIVQELVNSRLKVPCHFEFKDGDLCCVEEDPCRGGCTVYEMLDLLSFDERNRNTWFIDGWRYPSISGPCSEKGSKEIEGDVRGFPDNLSLKYDEITKLQNGWKRPGNEVCDCPDEGETGFGYHKLDTPPNWWDEYLYRGANFATVDYSCCNSPFNAMTFGSSSTGVQTITD